MRCWQWKASPPVAHMSWRVVRLAVSARRRSLTTSSQGSKGATASTKDTSSSCQYPRSAATSTHETPRSRQKALTREQCDRSAHPQVDWTGYLLLGVFLTAVNIITLCSTRPSMDKRELDTRMRPRPKCAQTPICVPIEPCPRRPSRFKSSLGGGSTCRSISGVTRPRRPASSPSADFKGPSLGCSGRHGDNE